METKILKAVFGGGTSTVTNKRTRTDYGQVLEISGVDLPSAFECIFSNSSTSAGTGKKMIGSAQRVLIPDEYLATGQTIYAWILLHDTEDDGRHMYSIRIPVADMPDTSPEEPTPVEQSVISQAITALNSAVTTTTQKALEATESADRAEQAAEGAEGYAERAESAQQAAESARDRATQAETSARTSAATASEKASEAISSATTASQSAMTAETASESAQEYATASAESASQASQSADTASESASASAENALFTAGKALDASNSASEAAQSASTATQAKTDAETAKQASETAQGRAEQARNEAVSAKTGAESARDEAQEIVDGITGKVEQIDSNTDRIESLEDDRYKPYATDTASGSIASFSDGADNIPLKSCIVQIEPVQAGSGDPSPENERPISGWTGVNINNFGKNCISNGAERQSITTSMYAKYTPVVSLEDATSTTFSVSADVPNGQTLKLYCWTGKYNSSIGTLELMPDGRYALTDTYTIKNAKEFRIYSQPYTGGSSVVTTVWDCTCVINETRTDYIPYVGQTIPIAFPAEAGTVYGGYIDPINGELTITHGTIDLATLTKWVRNMTGQNAIEIACTLNGKKVGRTNIISDMFKTGTETSAVDTAVFSICGYPSSALIAVKAPKSVVTDGDGLAAWIGANHPMACYELAEPIHYPLTPTEIKTLLGQNNIWADTGDVSVEYRADTTLYIKRLTDSDTDMVADSNIVSGQYFMVGNDLYKATVNIASGASVVVGTNAVKVSLATALNEINQ